jgi:hypothetical protein
MAIWVFAEGVRGTPGEAHHQQTHVPRLGDILLKVDGIGSYAILRI